MKELLLGSTPLYDGAAGAANATFAWVKVPSKAREDAHTLRLNADASATVTRDAAPRARGGGEGHVRGDVNARRWLPIPCARRC